LGILRRRFTATIAQGTPDALDLLVVCTEAGMGLESALERVSIEMELANPPMASILAGLLDDLRVLPSRRDAFNNLGTRSGVEGLRRLGAMLNQSQQYGTPLGSTLRAVAEELRRDRMNKLEEKAVKLPAKLVFPMIGFIMPSLYIVLLGPSFMRLADALTSMSSLH
jgi:tight adherence protein C